jgi:hypothetical protein
MFYITRDILTGSEGQQLAQEATQVKDLVESVSRKRAPP